MPDSERDDGVPRTLFAHNGWANLKLIDFCARLSAEQLDATGIGCYGTIRDTLVHVVGAEVSYVVRVNHATPPVPFTRGQFPGFPELRELASWTSDQLLQLALGARQDTLVRERQRDQACSYPLASLIMQALNHANEHRAQVAAIITQLGLEPPDMSGWAYMVETGEFQEFAAGE